MENSTAVSEEAVQHRMVFWSVFCWRDVNVYLVGTGYPSVVSAVINDLWDRKEIVCVDLPLAHYKMTDNAVRAIERTFGARFPREKAIW